MTEHIVEVSDLEFRYRRRPVLHEITFTLATGLTALLGPNGAGKTTLMKLLATLTTPSQGAISVEGVDATSWAGREQARSALGYLPQRFETLIGARVDENVEYAAWAHGVEPQDCPAAAQRALEAVDLADRRKSRVLSLSGGMRQRLGIACAIAHKPRLLLLDEPTVGIDPTQRLEIRQYLRAYAKDATVLLSTHMVEEIRTMASKVLVLSEGRLRFDGSLDQFAALGAAAAPGDALGSDLEIAYQVATRSAVREAA